MSQLVSKQKFYNTGNIKRVKENFQGYLFEEINLLKDKEPISFFRSDFRGSKFLNSTFYKNNFSRADLIDSIIISTRFKECLFQHTELYNSFFERSVIDNSIFKSVTCSRLYFQNCEIEEAKFHDATIKDTNFKDCKLHTSKFTKSSLDEIKFEECDIRDVDFSNMTAINLYFSNCSFQNLIIDADYLGSYFFKGNYLDKIKLKYRGKLINLKMQKHEIIDNLLRICLENRRYYEAINLFIQRNVLLNEKVSIYELTKKILQQLLNEENFLIRSYQLEKIFRIFEFYYNSDCLILDDYFKFIAFFDSFPTQTLSLDEQLLISNYTQNIKNLFDVYELNNEFINTSNANLGFIEITVSNENEQYFIKELDKFLANFISPSLTPSDVYIIAGKRKGSVVYEIVIYATVALWLLNILKRGVKQIRGISNTIGHIFVDWSINRKLQLEAKNALNIEKLNEIKAVQIISEQAIKDSAVPLSKAQELLSLIEGAKYFPNTFSNGGD